VRLAIPPAGRLNRLAVFFRLLLVIPAWLVSGILLYGAVAVMVPVGWLTALIGGGLPASLHQALAAVLRYLSRLEAYLFMVVPTYPSGVFGDTSVPDTAYPWLYQSMYNGSGVTSYLSSVDSGTQQLQQTLRNDAT